jgi:hypothetical protein
MRMGMWLPFDKASNDFEGGILNPSFLRLNEAQHYFNVYWETKLIN